MLERTTVVAVSTPPGSGGLAVVRLSGNDAVAIARRVFSAPEFGADPVTHCAVYGILHTPKSDPTDDMEGICEIDRCYALPFLAPRSFTGEDTVEFHTHGGQEVPRLVLAACREAGAEPAEAGEFTRRAFLNGKLSLDRAEAVADLIGARSAPAARAALRQLSGGLDRRLQEVEEPLLELAARLEGSFEFLDDEGMEVPRGEIVEVLASAVARMDELVAMAPAGRMLRDGVQVALVGAPNAGKSSLFNAMLDEDRAIVDDEPGTTRDVVSGRVDNAGTVFVLHDTAGLRDEAGRVETKGMDRTHRQVEAADLVLVLQEDDVATPVPDTVAPVIRVGSKADLGGQPTGCDVVTSARDGRGLEKLWSLMHDSVRRHRLDDAVAMGVILNERHRHRLGRCAVELAELRDLAMQQGTGSEVVGTMLAAILARLGEISGREFSEQLLDNVFSRFCVGK